MIVRIRLRPFAFPRDRAARLPWIVLAGLALLGLCLWNPVTTPGPVLCLSRLAFALPCPFCGATRGVALCLRGRPIEASAYNPLSLPVLLLGASLLALWSYEYVANREVLFVFRRPWRTLFVVLAFVVVISAWVYLLTCRREDDFAASWLGQMLVSGD
jgi:hypothetical protein